MKTTAMILIMCPAIFSTMVLKAQGSYPEPITYFSKEPYQQVNTTDKYSKFNFYIFDELGNGQMRAKVYGLKMGQEPSLFVIDQTNSASFNGQPVFGGGGGDTYYFYAGNTNDVLIAFTFENDGSFIMKGKNVRVTNVFAKEKSMAKNFDMAKAEELTKEAIKSIQAAQMATIKAEQLPVAVQNDVKLEAAIIKAINEHNGESKFPVYKVVMPNNWETVRHEASGTIVAREMIIAYVRNTAEEGICRYDFVTIGQDYDGKSYSSKVYIGSGAPGRPLSCSNIK